MIDLRALDRLDFAERNVTILGLGIEGVDLARYLARHGARVTVSDSRPAERLAERLQDVRGLPVELSLGRHDSSSIGSADAVFVSQSISLEMEALRSARDRGVPMFSMVGLFMDLVPGPVAGITGSSGKTTTTALVGEMLRADEKPVFVGGNIGVPLLDNLDTIRPYTWSVLEISHTQLQLFNRSPFVGAVLNITPNHLDRFSWDEYRALKANLIRYQSSGDIAVLGYDNAESRNLESTVSGRLIRFSTTGGMPGEGVFVRDGWATARFNGAEERIFHLDWVALRGAHNRENAVAAAAIALACGVQADAITCAIESFRGVPHRLEFVADAGGVSYYNDSIATTPERAVAGLRSFDEPVVLLLGGRDKNLPTEDLALEATRRCSAVVLFGESAPGLYDALAKAGAGNTVVAQSMEEAVSAAHRLAQPGDVVLLSPACTSYDAYENFEARGEHFRSLVHDFAREVRTSLP